MNELNKALLCVKINYMKLYKNPVILTVCVFCLIFSFWNMYDITELCFKSAGPSGANNRITIWVLPFVFMSPLVTLFYNIFVSLVFYNAPFDDKHTTFLMIRTGTSSWIMGQILYIFITSFIIPLFYYFTILLILSPSLGWYGNDWGGVLRSMAEEGQSIFERFGIHSHYGFFPDISTINNCSPLSTTITQFLLMWSSASFIGCLFLFFNVVCKKGSGTIVVGALICFATFSQYSIFAPAYFGKMINVLSLLAFVSRYSLYPFIDYAPTTTFVIVFMFTISIILSVITHIVYCNKDIIIGQDNLV